MISSFLLGKSPDKSFSQDSSDGPSNVETHRRSKSILKNKSESSVSVFRSLQIKCQYLFQKIVNRYFSRKHQPIQKVNDYYPTMHPVQLFRKMVRYVHRNLYNKCLQSTRCSTFDVQSTILVFNRDANTIVQSIHIKNV